MLVFKAGGCGLVMYAFATSGCGRPVCHNLRRWRREGAFAGGPAVADGVSYFACSELPSACRGERGSGGDRPA